MTTTPDSVRFSMFDEPATEPSSSFQKDDNDQIPSSVDEVQQLELQLEQDPCNYEVASRLLAHHKRSQDIVNENRLFEHIAAFCPTTKEFWLQRVTAQKELLGPPGESVVQERRLVHVFRRALTANPCVELWLAYFRFLNSRRIKDRRAFAPSGSAPSVACDKNCAGSSSFIRRACEIAVKELGTHPTDGPPLWAWYRNWEASMISQWTDAGAMGGDTAARSPVSLDTRSDTDKPQQSQLQQQQHVVEQVHRVVSLFARQMQLQLTGLQELLDEYRLFAMEAPGETLPLDALCEASRKECELRKPYECDVGLASNGDELESLQAVSAAWDRYIQFEKDACDAAVAAAMPGNQEMTPHQPSNLGHHHGWLRAAVLRGDRVSSAYARACEDLGHARADLWRSWALFALVHQRDGAKAAHILDRAVRYFPKCEPLWVLLLTCQMMRGSARWSMVERVRNTFARALLCMASSPSKHLLAVAMAAVATLWPAAKEQVQWTSADGGSEPEGASSGGGVDASPEGSGSEGMSNYSLPRITTKSMTFASPLIEPYNGESTLDWRLSFSATRNGHTRLAPIEAIREVLGKVTVALLTKLLEAEDGETQDALRLIWCARMAADAYLAAPRSSVVSTAAEAVHLHSPFAIQQFLSTDPLTRDKKGGHADVNRYLLATDQLTPNATWQLAPQAWPWISAIRALRVHDLRSRAARDMHLQRRLSSVGLPSVASLKWKEVIESIASEENSDVNFRDLSPAASDLIRKLFELGSKFVLHQRKGLLRLWRAFEVAATAEATQRLEEVRQLISGDGSSSSAELNKATATQTASGGVVRLVEEIVFDAESSSSILASAAAADASRTVVPVMLDQLINRRAKRQRDRSVASDAESFSDVSSEQSVPSLLGRQPQQPQQQQQQQQHDQVQQQQDCSSPFPCSSNIASGNRKRRKSLTMTTASNTASPAMLPLAETLTENDFEAPPQSPGRISSEVTAVGCGKGRRRSLSFEQILKVASEGVAIESEKIEREKAVKQSHMSDLLERSLRATWDGRECLPGSGYIPPIPAALSDHPPFRTRSSDSPTTAETATPPTFIRSALHSAEPPAKRMGNSDDDSDPGVSKKRPGSIAHRNTKKHRKCTDAFVNSVAQGKHFLQRKGKAPAELITANFEEETTVFVSNLDTTVREQELRKMLEDCDGVMEIRIVRDFAKRSKGFAYIDFDSAKNAAVAVEAKKGTQLHGSTLNLAISKPTKAIYEPQTLFASQIPTEVLVLGLEATRELIHKAVLDFAATNDLTVEITDVRLKEETDGRKALLNYGYVNFASEAQTVAILAAAEKQDGIVPCGKSFFKLNASIPMKDHRWHLANPNKEIKRKQKEKKEKEELEKSMFPPPVADTLFVKNLSFTTTEDELRELFKEHGAIVECVICRDALGKSKGFGFVAFQNPDSAFEARMLNGATIDGREISVSQSTRPITKPTPKPPPRRRQRFVLNSLGLEQEEAAGAMQPERNLSEPSLTNKDFQRMLNTITRGPKR